MSNEDKKKLLVEEARHFAEWLTGQSADALVEAMSGGCGWVRRTHVTGKDAKERVCVRVSIGFEQ